MFQTFFFEPSKVLNPKIYQQQPALLAKPFPALLSFLFLSLFSFTPFRLHLG